MHVKASVHGDVAFWVGYTLAAYLRQVPGEEASDGLHHGAPAGECANYDGEAASPWRRSGTTGDSNCGKCGTSQTGTAACTGLHHGPPGYMEDVRRPATTMATCSGVRGPGVLPLIRPAAGGLWAGSLAPGYTHLPMTCVNHHNIELHAGKTVAECAAICDANALCLAFEYGVDYGGDGEYEAGDCQEQSSAVLTHRLRRRIIQPGLVRQGPAGVLRRWTIPRSARPSTASARGRDRRRGGDLRRHMSGHVDYGKTGG